LTDEAGKRGKGWYSSQGKNAGGKGEKKRRLPEKHKNTVGEKRHTKQSNMERWAARQMSRNMIEKQKKGDR